LREAEGRAGGTVAPSREELEDVLMLSAAEAGFDLETFRKEGAREIAVSGLAAHPAALLGWPDALRRNHGLLAARLSARRDKSGMLRAEASLIRGGA